MHERNAMIPIAWSHFLRGRLGGDEYTAKAVSSARRLAQVSAELGDAPFEVQGLCILGIIDRLAGRLDAADANVEQALGTARRFGGMPEPLLTATAFMLAMARGGDPAQSPPPPAEVNPLALIADTVVVEAMLLAGAFDAAIERLAASPATAAAVATPFFARLVGAVRGAVLVLASRYDEAEEGLRAARDGARAVGAYPNEVATTALLAEVQWRRGDAGGAAALLDAVIGDPGGIAGLLLLRGRWLLGDAAAAPRARALAAELAAPGLAP